MSSITPIAKQFALHNRLFNNVLEGIADAHGGDRLSDHVNHLQWIAGHLVGSRSGVAGLVGIQPTFPYKDVYSDPTQPPPGNRAIDPSISYPPLSEILHYWNDIAEAFTHAVKGLGEEQLAMELPVKTPVGGNTLFDLLSFLASHESYHIGQMSIIRKYLGLSAMSYK
jgi:hypothetical protein